MSTTDAPVVEDRRIRRTKARLREAVVELVLEHGYQAVTVERIAERADVTRATLYTHYSGKEELLAAVVDEFGDRVVRAISALEDIGDGESRLVTLFEEVRAESDLLRLIVRGEGDGTALRRLTERVRMVVTDTTEAAMADAGAKPRLDVDLVVRLRTAAIVEAVAWFVDQPDADPATTANAVSDAIANGWRWAVGIEAPTAQG